MNYRMLIVEDDEGLRPSLEKSFKRRGHEVLGVGSVSDAIGLLKRQNFDLILLDIQLSDGSGFDVLSAALDFDNEIVVIIMTAFADVKNAVRALREGARDFVTKPFELEELHLDVERAMETRALRRNVELLKRERLGEREFTEIMGESTAINEVRELIRKVADTDTSVLITGETGTGKELVANAIHQFSSRAKGPLVKVNCSAFSEQILESELFGHEKGAFTDAKRDRAGLFEMANGGTLFLDEISEMKSGLQAKLLRVVEGMPFRRVGGRREIQTDVRIVAATNTDAAALLQSSEFRDDLYYRLNTFPIEVPSLRSRGDDVVLLARAFLQSSAGTLRKNPITLDLEAENVLRGYPWPGNVRELRNVMERVAILCETGEIMANHLPAELRVVGFLASNSERTPASMSSLDEMIRLYIKHVLDNVGGNISDAARVLGIARNTLKSKVQM